MIKKSLYMICTASILSASATMCYKKEHLDPSTIETVALSGGECNDRLSVNDMKKDGYQVDSMKIQNGVNGFNYIYVFQKENNRIGSVSQSSVSLTKEDLKVQLIELQKEQKIEKEKEEKISSIQNGKKVYDSTCKKCHGNGKIVAYNRARPLVELTENEFGLALGEFRLGERKSSVSLLMTPYANLLGHKDEKDIYNYIQTLK